MSEVSRYTWHRQSRQVRDERRYTCFACKVLLPLGSAVVACNSGELPESWEDRPDGICCPDCLRHYLETTRPSDYDTTGRSWALTIGHMQSEDKAQALVAYLQEHGDEWRPVDLAKLGWRRGTVEMTELWLCCLQRVRKPRPGPPELIVSPHDVLQLRYPNGYVRAAAFDFTADELDSFRVDLAANHEGSA